MVLKRILVGIKDKIKRLVQRELEYNIEVRLNDYQLLQFKGKELMSTYKQYIMSAILVCSCALASNLAYKHISAKQQLEIVKNLVDRSNMKIVSQKIRYNNGDCNHSQEILTFFHLEKYFSQLSRYIYYNTMVENNIDILVDESVFDNIMEMLSTVCKLTARRIKINFDINQYGDGFDEYQRKVVRELLDKSKIAKREQIC